MLGALSFGEGLLIPRLAFLGRKPGDGVEFFTQMRLILKKEEGRRSLPCPEVRMDRTLLYSMGGIVPGLLTCPLHMWPPSLHSLPGSPRHPISHRTPTFGAPHPSTPS